MALFKKKTEKKASVKAEPKTTKAASHQPAGLVLNLHKPHVTEKTLRLSEQNKYVFIAPVHITKTEAAKQIEKLYGVTCVTSNVMPGKPKPKSWRGKTRATEKFRKIIVTIKQGQKIELTGNN